MSSRAVDLLASKLPKPRKPISQRFREKLPFATQIPLHASLTYLLAICLFSISFLVFLNSSLSFVVTDLLDVQDGVGNIVGTLGFADELVAVFAVVFWGALSDKIGTRLVAVCGYLLVGLALILVAQVRTIYPGLLLVRILFSLGASATVVSVTAILPEISIQPPKSPESHAVATVDHIRESEDGTLSGRFEASTSAADPGSSSNPSAVAASSSSTSTSSTLVPPPPRPIRRRPGSRMQQKSSGPKAITGKLSGIVGFTAGAGALIALTLFLPLPTRFAKDGHMTKSEALKHSFLVVGSIAWIISIVVFIGLRGAGVGGSTWEFWKIGKFAKLWRRNEKDKSPSPSDNVDVENPEHGEVHEETALLAENRDSLDDDDDETVRRRENYDSIPPLQLPPPVEVERSWKGSLQSYSQGLLLAMKAGHEDWRIGLAYLGGFVARSMSVGISLFIPLYVNQWMRYRGMCPSGPSTDPNFKETCREGYILAAELTGTSQLFALIFAPIIGYFSDRYEPQLPLLTTSILGFLACAAFAALPSLAVGANRSWAFVHCSIMGIAQIGAIVSSLALIGNAVNGTPSAPSLHRVNAPHAASHTIVSEAESVNPIPLGIQESRNKNRLAVKGAISGVYSLCGAVGILVLTKFGGWGVDHANSGFAFDLLAVFFAIEIALGSWLVIKGETDLLA